ncbi:MAG: outer membrane protein assembly factor BamD [Acidobacteriota bacterium]
MSRRSRRLRLSACLAWGIWLAAFVACGGKDVDTGKARASQGDQRLLELGNQALENKKWEEARGYFRQLLDTYPRSQLAGDARLGIAETYFNQKGGSNLVLAIAEYRDFLTFFPNHPRADYAQYRIAMAYYRQMHGPDRDQEPTRTAVEEFEKLIELYRNSLYAEEGRKLLQECYDNLGQHEVDVARFYLRTRKWCRGAIARLKTVLQKYPTYGKTDEVYFYLGEAHRLCNRPSEAMPYYKQVIDNFPTSEHVREAEERLDALRSQMKAAVKNFTSFP